jgi:NAD(P)-dependent dehydrogenase (short-subunit alcohol dehydrogenase family)
LEGRKILVSGGTSGLGAAIVRAAVDAGADVGILGRRQELLDELAADSAGRSSICPSSMLSGPKFQIRQGPTPYFSHQILAASSTFGTTKPSCAGGASLFDTVSLSQEKYPLL